MFGALIFLMYLQNITFIYNWVLIIPTTNIGYVGYIGAQYNANLHSSEIFPMRYNYRLNNYNGNICIEMPRITEMFASHWKYLMINSNITKILGLHGKYLKWNVTITEMSAPYWKYL